MIWLIIVFFSLNIHFQFNIELIVCLNPILYFCQAKIHRSDAEVTQPGEWLASKQTKPQPKRCAAQLSLQNRQTRKRCTESKHIDLASVVITALDKERTQVHSVGKAVNIDTCLYTRRRKGPWDLGGPCATCAASIWVDPVLCSVPVVNLLHPETSYQVSDGVFHTHVSQGQFQGSCRDKLTLWNYLLCFI